MKELICKYKEAFVLRDNRIGCYKGPIQHRIDLVDDAKPFVARARREPPHLKEEQRKQDDELIKQGIIEPSTSLWCAPARLVPKKNGEYRYAIDFRGTNAVTKKMVYSLPLITEQVEIAARSCLFSSFDFQSGFFQIPLFKKHKERTAFASFYGLFQFTRMAMGLCGAPQTFQRVMEDMKRQLSEAFLIYLDDVALCSENEDDHLNDIECFLKTILNYGLKLRIDKCQFGRSELKYLGYLISKNSIRPDPRACFVV